MRIIHTTLRYPPATGGVERYVQDCVSLTRPDHDVRVLTSKLKTHGPPTLLEPESLLDDPAHVQRLHHSRTPFLSYPRLQALGYYLEHHQPELIHGHGFWYHPADRSAKYAEQHRIPFILNPYFYQNEVRLKPAWQLYLRTRGRKTFARADVVVVISPYEEESIRRAGLPVKRFALIPPGVEMTEFAVEKSNPYTAKGLSGPAILSVGRLAKAKGLDDVISALPKMIRAIPDLNYIIIGEDFGRKRMLMEAAEKAGVHDRVHFWGNVTREELIGAYQHADLFIHPSQFELFGIVLIEAMAAQTPVLARKSSAMPYVVDQGRAGLLFETTEELAAKATAVLSNQVQVAKLKEAGLNRVRTNFSRAIMRERLTNLYEEF